MNWSTSLLLVVVVASNVIAASALDCYSCETHRNGACGEQFNSDKVATCNNGGICARKTDKDNVKRWCMVDNGHKEGCTGAEDTTTGRTCYCKQDKCNMAAQSVSSIGPLTALGFVAFTALVGQLFHR